MRTIKIGSRGKDVQSWQTFLRGGQVAEDGSCTAREGDAIISDGIFGPATDRATKAWQTTQGLVADGIVGRATWAEAVKDSYPSDAIPATHDTDPDTDVDSDPEVETKPSEVTVDKTTAKWPACPAGFKPLVSNAARNAIFGTIEFVGAPTAGNPEAIHITNDWASKNMARFDIPLLSSHPIMMHKLAGPQFRAWFQAIEKKGLADRVVSYSGCWVPRYVRGSRKTLSNHSWGVAIDINVPWNGRGRQSALLGKRGCVRELAELASDFGIFWGGWYKGAPEDGMHFEQNILMTATELLEAKAKYGI